MRYPSAADRRGFTLVEALAALTVTGAVLVTALAAVGADVRAGRAVVEAQEAAAAMETALERAALRSRAGLLRGAATWRSLPPPLDDRRWRYRARPLPSSPGVIQVVVEVRDREGGTETVATRLFRPRPARNR